MYCAPDRRRLLGKHSARIARYTQAVIDESSWQWPEVFNWLQRQVTLSAMKCIAPSTAASGDYCPACSGSGQSPRPAQCQRENAWKIGIIKASDSEQRVVTNNEYCGAYFRQRK